MVTMLSYVGMLVILVIPYNGGESFTAVSIAFIALLWGIVILAILLGKAYLSKGVTRIQYWSSLLLLPIGWLYVWLGFLRVFEPLAIKKHPVWVQQELAPMRDFFLFDPFVLLGLIAIITILALQTYKIAFTDQ